MIVQPSWNVVLGDGFAYSAAGELGLVVYQLPPGKAAVPITGVEPPAGSERIDDVALADGLLFTLDASHPGALCLFSLEDPAEPRLVAGPVAVEVEPFSGVSAAGGRVVVSGGTSRLSVRGYQFGSEVEDASLGEEVAWTDLGLGQPDVILHPSGEVAFVSTDFSSSPKGYVDGARFGITVLSLKEPPETPEVLARVGIPGAGFTPGTALPANFALEGALLGDYLYLAFGGGLAVVSVAVPSSPEFLGIHDPEFHGISVAANGEKKELYLVGSFPQPVLAVFTLEELASPEVQQLLPMNPEGMPMGVATEGQAVVVANARFGVVAVGIPELGGS